MSSFGEEELAVKPFMLLRFVLAPASEYPLAIGLSTSFTLTTSNLFEIKNGH